VVPILFHLGRVGFPTHDVFTFLGLTTALIIFGFEARRRDVLDEKLGWVVLGSLTGGAIFAKASVVWRYVALAPHPTVTGVLVYGGKSIVGGLAGAYVGALVTKRIVRYPGKTGDVFAPAVVAGLAIGRVGCLLTEQIGTPTSLPWGIRLSPEVAARVPNCPQCLTGVPMHPSFAYEIVFLIASFAVLSWLRSRIAVPGELFKIFLASYAVFRFLVEFVRGNEQIWLGLSGTQLFLIPSTAVLLVYLARQFVRGAYSSAASSQRVEVAPVGAV